VEKPITASHTSWLYEGRKASPQAQRAARTCDAMAVASKYDEYWLTRRRELGVAIERAAAGEGGTLDVSDLGELGQRGSWYGSATVQGSTVVNSTMAHTTSLSHVVAALNMCSRRPEKAFRFTVSHGLTLAVVMRLSLPGPRPIARPVRHRQAAAPAVATRGMPESMDAAMTCEKVHALEPGRLTGR
jgi:hypothetical protein